MVAYVQLLLPIHTLAIAQKIIWVNLHTEFKKKKIFHMEIFLGPQCENIATTTYFPYGFNNQITINRFQTTTTNPCLPNPCKNTGMCTVNTNRESVCFCFKGYSGIIYFSKFSFLFYFFNLHSRFDL